MGSNTQNSQVDIFHAIADPTRRRLLDLIARHDLPVKELAQAFAMSRPAISQHLRILQQAGLVVERRVGREHHYHVQAEPLRQVSEWVQTYEHFWQHRLEQLAEHLDSMEQHHDKQQDNAG